MSSTNFESSHAPSIGTFGWMAATDTEPLSSVDGLSDSPYNTDTTAITPAAVSTTMPVALRRTHSLAAQINGAGNIIQLPKRFTVMANTHANRPVNIPSVAEKISRIR